MAMSVNFLAILLSLAMMLTGAGGDGQPAEASRMLTLHDVSLTINDETVALAPSLELGAYTDGEKAVFSLGVPMGDETLFPIQLGVSDAGVTALFEKSDVAVNVSANALNALSEQLEGQLAENFNAAMGQMSEENSGLTSVLMNDYIPAYIGLFEALQDETFLAQVQKDAEEIVYGIIDRGEGTPVTEMIEGEEYALTSYTYTIEGDQMAELADALYTSNDVFSAFYDALFKLYGALPEESGLNDLTSFADLFEKFGFDMRLDMQEKVSEEGDVEISDGVLTVDLNSVISTVAESQGSEEEIPELEPIVMEIHSLKEEGHTEGELRCDYDQDGTGLSLDMNFRKEDAHMDLTMSMGAYNEDVQVASFDLNASEAKNEATGTGVQHFDYSIEAEDVSMHFTLQNSTRPDGVEVCDVEFSADTEYQDLVLSFTVDVTGDPIEDHVNGHEAFVIDDLSEESLQALGEDEAFQANLMQVVGSLSADAQKLVGDESVQKLVGLFTFTPQVDYEDNSFEDEDNVDNYDDYDYEYEEPEDDGELGFEVPEFTWLPEGWSVGESNVDTAYDMVDISLSGESADSFGYAMFYADADDSQTNYVVDDDGNITPVEGREVTVSDYGDGSVYVMLKDSGVNSSLSFTGADIDMETIGKIIAGIKF